MLGVLLERGKTAHDQGETSATSDPFGKEQEERERREKRHYVLGSTLIFIRRLCSRMKTKSVRESKASEGHLNRFPHFAEAQPSPEDLSSCVSRSPAMFRRVR